jgi:hypothetical protein
MRRPMNAYNGAVRPSISTRRRSTAIRTPWKSSSRVSGGSSVPRRSRPSAGSVIASGRNREGLSPHTPVRRSARLDDSGASRGLCSVAHDHPEPSGAHGGGGDVFHRDGSRRRSVHRRYRSNCFRGVAAGRGLEGLAAESSVAPLGFDEDWRLAAFAWDCSRGPWRPAGTSSPTRVGPEGPDTGEKRETPVRSF